MNLSIVRAVSTEEDTAPKMLFGAVSRLHGGAVGEARKVVKTIYLKRLNVDLSWVYYGGFSNCTDPPFDLRSNILNLCLDAISVLIIH